MGSSTRLLDQSVQCGALVHYKLFRTVSSSAHLQGDRSSAAGTEKKQSESMAPAYSRPQAAFRESGPARPRGRKPGPQRRNRHLKFVGAQNANKWTPAYGNQGIPAEWGAWEAQHPEINQNSQGAPNQWGWGSAWVPNGTHMNQGAWSPWVECNTWGPAAAHAYQDVPQWGECNAWESAATYDYQGIPAWGKYNEWDFQATHSNQGMPQWAKFEAWDPATAHATQEILAQWNAWESQNGQPWQPTPVEPSFAQPGAYFWNPATDPPEPISHNLRWFCYEQESSWFKQQYPTFEPFKSHKYWRQAGQNLPINWVQSRPLSPATSLPGVQAALDEQWRKFTADAIATDGWTKLCWRQFSHSVDPASGEQVPGPMELSWVKFGEWDLPGTPASNVPPFLLAAACRKFRALFPEASPPPTDHHLGEYYAPWVHSYFLGGQAGTPMVWLYKPHPEGPV